MTAFLILLETLIKKDAQKMIEVMHIDQIRNWFGNRGYPFDTIILNLGTKLLMLEARVGSLFMTRKFDEFDEVANLLHGFRFIVNHSI
jgi:glutamine amidotransferase PdxT